MKRYVLNNLNSFEGAKLVEDKHPLLVSIDVPYQVDDSQFSPVSSALKQIAGRSIPEDVKNAVFDFPNGNGKPGPLPAGRIRSNFIPEIEKELRDSAGLKNKVLNEVQNEVRLEKVRKQALSKAQSTAQPSSSDSSSEK